MSRQIQIRRGTTLEHATFTGAIGEITMDTDKKTIRVHDGQTAGGTMLAKFSDVPSGIDYEALGDFLNQLDNIDYVIESQTTDTGWYRKYKSGWIEQGGEVSVSATSLGGGDASDKTITLIKPVVKIFSPNVNIVYTSGQSLGIAAIYGKTTAAFGFTIKNLTSSTKYYTGWTWEAKGMALE